jgi:hypothetical protein
MDFGGLTYDGKRGAGYLPFSCPPAKPISESKVRATQGILAAFMAIPLKLLNL